MNSSGVSTESIPGFGVYTGFWINWSHGKFLGSTLTLDRRDGGLLISFLALFVTFVGTAFWRVSCFAFHQYFASEAPRDGIYHQRQAILRNSANSATGLCTLVQTIWAWRGSTSKPYSRLLPLGLFTITSLAIFAVAGIFSSKIATSTGTEVLISSPNCGTIQPLPNATFEDVSASLFPYQNQRKKTFVTYSQQCYSNTSNAEDCGLYVQKRLPTIINRNASCPFPKEFCHSEWNNIEFDTGYLDSNDDFGFNSPQRDRFQFRRIMRCAPMAKDGFRNQTSIRMADGNRVRYMMHYYGMSLDYTFNLNDTDFSPPTPADPYTYMYPDLEGGRWEPEYQFSASPEYSIASLVARYYNGSFSPNASNFKPLPGLGRPDYELMLFFLSTNTVMFSKETDDPWYSAHTDTGTDWSYSYKNDNKDTLEGEMRFYFADAPASAVGCTEQMQVCNPNSKTPEERCTSIMAKVDLTDTMIPRSFWASQRQRSLFWYFSRFMLGDRTQLTDLIDLLGVFSLTSRNSLRIGIQGPIPDNQWQLDMESMHAATLSILQGNIFDFAAGPSDPSVLSWLRQGSKKEFKYACENQKIRSTAYTSFNTFGLCTTLAAGTFIILLSYTVEPLVGRIRRRCGRDAHARLEWCANETLQLQRLAHEELGLGGRWARAADAVPVTEGAGAQRLGVLDVADPDHPRLKAPPADLEIADRGGEGRAGEAGRGGGGRDGKGDAVVREVSGGSSASSTDVEERRERMGEAQLVSPISASPSCP